MSQIEGCHTDRGRTCQTKLSETLDDELHNEDLSSCSSSHVQVSMLPNGFLTPFSANSIPL